MSEPRILLFDLETAPAFGTFWSRPWDTNILKVHADWYILMAGYKWLGEKKIHLESMFDYDLFDTDPKDDYAVCLAMHKLLEEADVVIAHNGRKFDIPKIKTRFAVHGFAPTSPFKIIDTLTIARYNFSFLSNKLNDLGEALGLGQKLPTGGYSLWEECMAGVPKAWNSMGRYCKRDVQLLEDVYLALRPWDDKHPNLAIYTGGFACPVCRSENVQQRGYKRNNTYTYKQYVCNDCGKWSKKRLSEKAITKPDLT